MNRISRRAALTLAAAALPRFAIAQSTPELQTMRSTSKSWLWLAEDYGRAGGFFDRAGVKVVSNASNRGVNITALAGSGIDIVLGDPGEVFNARRENLPVRIFVQTVGKYASHVVIKQAILQRAGVSEASPVAQKIAVLKGLLESVSDRVNMVNAPVIAQERGIKVVESKASRPRDFASTITTRVRSSVDRLIAGAIFHGGQPRIVRIDDFMLEVIPEGPTLLLHNHDRPGVVGTVGTILGEEGINIARMQLALVRERGEAAMLVNVDQRPDERVMERLRNLPNMIAAQLVEL